MTADAESMNLIRQARDKAAVLVEKLVQQQAEIEANPPNIDAPSLAKGRLAMQNAIDAARRTLDSIDQAMKIASTSSN